MLIRFPFRGASFSINDIFVIMWYLLFMNIGFLQYSPKKGNKEQNLEIVRKLLADVSGEVWVLPELGMTGYPDSSKEELLSHAESMDGPLVKELIKIARESDSCIIVGILEVDGDKVFNTTVSVGPEGLLNKHQKSHLFMEEKENFSSGESQPSVFTWRGINIGVGVCYDYMFPEFWRKLALADADLFCNTANFVSKYGFRMMQARSIENGVFSITTNRTGTDGEIFYQGGSEIVDNRGNVLVKADDHEEKAYTMDVDLTLSRNKKWNKLNDLFVDRREDLY